MRVTGLWRYPVKSLQGEPLQSAELTLDGVAGDRLVHVSGPRGPLTGRTRYGLLTIPARTGLEGVPLVAGHRWDSEEAAAIIAEKGGPGARLVADDGPDRFDVLNLLVATDGAVERFGYDVRRLRPNLLLSGVPADIEPTMPGQAIAIGDAVIGVHSVRGRCVVTSIDPDAGEQDMDVFRHIHAVFGGELALNSWVVRPGTVRIGDEARLVDLEDDPAHIGGWIVGASYPHAPQRARTDS